jgi:hypothetical protein
MLEDGELHYQPKPIEEETVHFAHQNKSLMYLIHG